MRRFLITSPKYHGQAEVIYNDAEVLCKIDCTDTDMNAGIIHHFKNAVGPTVDTIGKQLPSCIIVEADFEVTFDMFWKKYNKKINKSRCILLWGKLNKAQQVQAYFGIDPYDKFLKKEHWRTKADPETYLRNQYWENEYR
jgi:hypothetical protein